MSEATHTPGPWRVKPLPSNCVGCREIQGPKHEPHKQAQHTDIACTVGLANDDRDAANATLIAAAPELLAALEVAAAEMKRLGGFLSAKGQGATLLGMAEHKARAAIAAAKAGGPS